MAPNEPAPADRPLLRKAEAKDAEPLTRLFLASRARTMPYLPKVHSDADTLAWMTHVVLPGTTVWVAETGTGTGDVLGFASVDGTELEHLYLRPDVRRRGIGSLLLAKAREISPEELTLYAFQRNTDARAFYERHGFAAVDFNDGSRNEEKEPDVLYRWTARG
ncbi:MULTISPECIES: GNAT family N-acetyltransferase [Streptomyces]|jgi:GNAT superfamily N-acetyltransferase|uniref:GNAT family N-acetyltransferase n=1 Tax=unclassified Streptomyces TaxID=2593676 RepID=UPI0029A3F88A|nr:MULTISPECIES: GNAT family N-acetyltransferase [unclassified Streptomyces]MDX2729816.1 GNAT family N-acetyltransferase [Streptomyces sp. PA03-2a]MDX3768466.1 GNAT family N-acetyltransferase [Streptomyces sp. AK08-01B]MDX3817797.1 GNAT family N-acetyltransferase [Streptomyces sp. AK08-01A]